MFSVPIPLAADDMQRTTNANPLHLCDIMLPFLAQYDRDDLCSGIVHRRTWPSKDKFSVFCIDRKHRCDTFSVARTDNQETHFLFRILMMVLLMVNHVAETSKCPWVDEDVVFHREA